MVDLIVDSITRSFGRWSLGPVSFASNGCSSISILGPSGSGKTTLLRIIAGIETADSGRIIIGGKDMTLKPPQDRGVGMVFQEPTLFPHMTARENIVFGMDNLGYAKELQKSKLSELEESFHLSSLMDKKPHQLSGGEKQRVAIARSVVVEPSLLLFDEPLSSLDRRSREELRGDLKSLQSRYKMTYIYVTHDHSEALYMGDIVAVIRDGKIEQIGSYREICAHPKNRFVAWFMGYNIIEYGNKVMAVLPENVKITENREGIDAVIVSGKMISNVWIGYLNVGNSTISVESDRDYTAYIGKKIYIELDDYLEI